MLLSPNGSDHMTLETKFNLAVEHQRSGRYAEAEALYREILTDLPAAEVFNNLALVLDAQGRSSEAILAFTNAIAASPGYAQSHLNLGISLLRQGRYPEALTALKTVLELSPDNVDALNAMGNACLRLGEPSAAIDCYTRATLLRPDFADPYNNLGVALEQVERRSEAIALFQRALAANPDFTEAEFNLAGVLLAERRYDEAIRSYRRVLATNPNSTAALNNLGTALKEVGDVEGAIQCYRHALDVAPDQMTASNLVYTLHFSSTATIAAIRTAHDEFNRTYCSGLAQRSHRNSRITGRRLRVGYVSPDLRFHPVGRFLLPLLRNQDRDAFETVCYSDVSRPDGVTTRLKASVDQWRETRLHSDETLFAAIREDEIDILIDLSAHMQGNRMGVFARKPAPVQVTYLAYCSTTGLEAMDYRVSDPYLDPPERPGDTYCERTLRLPSSYWCYEPWGDHAAPTPLPLDAKGHVTFGCLNNFAKVTREMMDLWLELLGRLPLSVLKLHAPPGEHRSRILSRAVQFAVSPARIEFVPFCHPTEYLAHYREIDIALDPYPYAGGTTSCDALWMGVPIVTRFGETAVSRAGLSILSNVGLQDLAVEDAAEYLQVAEHLARDTQRLRDLRSQLQEMMKLSALMDGPTFAADFGLLLRQAWVEWCDRRVRD